ncbi:hypothetical protein LCGC14_2394680 [marine sediment metagenome]|uniref:Uncharacterized protein n=1 Tax=marine sediment metagenome TaxID=412755 RepID=A0A0F9E9I9_9ZZZZ
MNENERLMVYELDDSGEKKKVEVAEEELQSFLISHPEQVFVIIREDLRRIFFHSKSVETVASRWNF